MAPPSSVGDGGGDGGSDASSLYVTPSPLRGTPPFGGRDTLPDVHSTTIHVRWGELDPYHHVNHATYLSYLEHARISALESIGWGMDVLTAAGYQVVVVGIDIRFRRPATAGDTLVIESSVAHLGASESSWRQVIRRGDEVIVEATVHAAATNLAGRPVRAPAALKEALGGLRA